MLGVNTVPNLLNISQWTVGQGSVGMWTQMGKAINNDRRYIVGPWGKEILMWEAIEDDTTPSQYGGGWNSTTLLYIDPTKTYRFSVWMNRTVTGNGSFYLGSNTYNSSGTNIGLIRIENGASDTNAYFYSGTGFVTGEWFLVVGHIYPYDYSGTTMHADAGRWRYSTRTKYGTITREFKWRDTSVRTIHRSFLYGSTNPDTRQLHFYPRVELCDGTEPTIQQLLRNGSFYTSVSSNLNFLSFNFRDVVSH